MRFGELQFLIAAAVLHLAIPVGAAVAPRYNYAEFALADAARDHVEIELDMSGMQLPVEEHYVDRPQQFAATDPRRMGRPFDPSRPIVLPPDDYTDPLSESPPDVDNDNPMEMTPDPRHDPDEYNIPPPRADFGTPGLPPGLGGPAIWRQYPGIMPSDDRGSLPAPTEAPRRKYHHKRAARLLPDGVRGKDRQLGLDFPGLATVKKAATRAVRQSDAPDNCSGTFTITVNPSGKVTSVAHGSHSGGDAAVWASIRQHLQAQLAAHKFQLKSSFEKGAVIGVAVASEMRMPSGSGGRKGASWSFDVSNAGQSPRRVVSASAHATPRR